MKEDLKKIKISLLIPAIFVLILWVVQFFNALSDNALTEYGILPRMYSGLKGIIFYPLIHGSWQHLYSNSIPVFVLGALLVYFFERSALSIFLIIYLLSGSLLWLGGRQSYHIGASGLIYGLAAFLFFSGFFKGKHRLLPISLVIIFLYGGLIWGVLPGQDGISWEGHLFGALSGSFTAFLFRKKGVKDPEIKFEDEEEDEHTPTLSIKDYIKIPNPNRDH